MSLTRGSQARETKLCPKRKKLVQVWLTRPVPLWRPTPPPPVHEARP